jgi:GNAT superfamily N-acetyltransferase
VTKVMLRRARPDEASTLSELALAAKGFWGYDQAFIESCRAELTFSPDDLARRHLVVADLGGLVGGFYTIDGEPPVGELGNMWVRPSEIGTGLGRIMWQDAMAAAAAAGFEYLEIDAEPNAEGFYRKMGAQRIGETPSGSIPGRTLPLMRVRVPRRLVGADLTPASNPARSAWAPGTS